MTSSAVELLDRDRQDAAEQLVRSSLRKIGSPTVGAEVLRDVSSETLARGLQSGLVLEAYGALLAVADEHLAAGDTRAAANAFSDAMRLATHRVLHFDGMSSPMAEDPAGFTAPLRASEVAARMRAPRGRGGAAGVGVSTGSTSGRGLTSGGGSTSDMRLLVMTWKNDNFLGPILRLAEEMPDVELRFEKLAGNEHLERFATSPRRVVTQTLGGKKALPQVAEAAFRAHVDWADVVLVEWCTALAVLLNQIDPGDTRVVVRLHSYEVFTVWPHLLDFSRVDDLIFVSEHLRDFALAVVPGLSRPGAPRLHVIPNAMDLQRFDTGKPDDARFTLGLVGASTLVKDPRWAIDVLRALRKVDGRYRLLLVDADLAEPTPAAREYAEGLRSDLAELEPTGAVRRLPRTHDVPGVLRDIGVIVSSSVRESFHLGLVEGAASGAVPVVRDWPFFPGGARRLFPGEWVVDTPEDAARRVLAMAASEEEWRKQAQAASAYAKQTWDWSVVRRDFERLLRRP